MDFLFSSVQLHYAINQDIFNLCFRAGFVIDGFYEECFKTNKEIPMVMIVRLKKVKRDTLQ